MVFLVGCVKPETSVTKKGSNVKQNNVKVESKTNNQEKTSKDKNKNQSEKNLINKKENAFESQKPEWIYKPPRQHGYLYVVGISSVWPSSYESDARDQARMNAYSQVAEFIGHNLKKVIKRMMNKIESSSGDESGNSVANNDLEEIYKSTKSMIANQSVSHVEFIKYYNEPMDKGKIKVYVLAKWSLNNLKSALRNSLESSLKNKERRAKDKKNRDFYKKISNTKNIDAIIDEVLSSDNIENAFERTR